MVNHLPTVTALGWEDCYDPPREDLTYLWLLGRYPIRVQKFWVPAVEAMEFQLKATNYEDPCDYIGSLMVRNISGSTFASWHSYGGAIDLDYGGDTDGDGDPTIDKNPHLHRRIYPGDPGFGVEFQLLEHQVHAIEAIRTNNGKRVWRWLGWSIGDTMHFEPNCSPDDIATGIDPTSLLGGGMNCPWTNTTMAGEPWYTTQGPCNDHYSAHDAPLAWGVNTGVCNVPSWGEGGVDDSTDDGTIKAHDNNRDDFNRILTDGRWWVMRNR